MFYHFGGVVSTNQDRFQGMHAHVCVCVCVCVHVCETAIAGSEVEHNRCRVVLGVFHPCLVLIHFIGSFLHVNNFNGNFLSPFNDKFSV